MTDSNPTGLSDNAAGALAYVTIVPAIVFLVMPPYNASSYVRFHAWQSIFLNIAAIVFSIGLSFVAGFGAVFGMFFFLMMLSRLLWLAWFLIWVLCVVKAINGERFKLPLIGDLAAKQAGS
jgi:uncharacterized membrane protein